MPRPRLYPSDAAKQQAHRDRKRRKALAPHVPWKQIGPCTVYCSDWQEVATLFPRHAAVITDPPYPNNYDYTKDRRRPSQWDDNYAGLDQPFDPTPWLQFPEVILMGAAHYWDRLPPPGSCWCWHKTPGRKPADFAACEWIWLSKPGLPRYYPYLWAGGMREGEENYSRLPQKLHPAQKPIALLEDLVKETTSAVVIDPYMGSGTTLAACVRQGRACIGVELEPKYFAVACARLQQEVEARAGRTSMGTDQGRGEGQEAAD